jgi:hypothetical protein
MSTNAEFSKHEWLSSGKSLKIFLYLYLPRGVLIKKDSINKIDLTVPIRKLY